ncbi:MAG: hypothetical protein D6796_12980 [Caldilineae bacterium]|nr:MAG: hypothetical protein D6796_12980 [Caldilineae bacterium]
MKLHPTCIQFATLALGAPLVMGGSRLLCEGNAENGFAVVAGALLFLAGQAIVRFEDFGWEKKKGLPGDKFVAVQQTQLLTPPLCHGEKRGG